MNRLVKRLSDSRDRFFPPITASLYGAAVPNAAGSALNTTAEQTPSSSARAIIELAEQELGGWSLWTGRSLNPAGQLGRLLQMHRSALVDELDGRWTRADFYWRRILSTLRHMDAQPGLWSELDQRFCAAFTELSGTFRMLRLRVITELLIDSNCALINGRRSKLQRFEPGDRIFVYAVNISELYRICELDDANRWSLAEPMADALITAHLEQGQLGHALNICERTACDFPRRFEYQDLFVKLQAQSTLAELTNSEDGTSNLADARRLGNAINSLVQFSKSYPFNPTVYESLGLLSQIRAVKLANGGELSEALLSIEESLTYAPASKQARDLREQLLASMQNLKAQIVQIEAEIAKTPGAALNAHGQRLRHEARKGSRSADRFVESGSAKKLSQAVQLANAVRLWQLAGLAGEDADIVGSASTLYDGLMPLFAEAPQDHAALSSQLDDVLRGIPTIDATRRKSLENYLAELFFDEHNSEPPDTVEPTLALLEPRVLTQVPSREPPGMWLFSREALGAKLLATIAIVALVASGVMAIREAYQQNRRDRSYAELIHSVGAGDTAASITAADAFLSANGLHLDKRLSQVRALQEQALMASKRSRTDAAYAALIAAVRNEDADRIKSHAEHFQTLTVDTPSDPRVAHVTQLQRQAADIATRAKRDAIYTRLVQAVEEQNADPVVTAAEAFLAVPQNYVADPRTEKVEKVLAEARELPFKRIRDAAYTNLLSAIKDDIPALMLEAAETFLAAPRINGRDDRGREVIGAYSKAFVTWFVALEDPNTDPARQRIASYQTLVGGTIKGGQGS